MNNNEKQQLKEFWSYWDNRLGRCCFNCGDLSTERAHIIGQGKRCRKKYGNAVINNPLDWLPSCSGCNTLIDIGHNLNADRVATIILLHSDIDDKRSAIEDIVKMNIKRKQKKNREAE